MTNQSDKYKNSPLGVAEIIPGDPVPAGKWGTWKIEYLVPELGIDDGGSVRFAIRGVSDWGVPQVSVPAADHYATVSCTNPETSLVLSWRPRASVRPYQEHLFVEVLDAPLSAGDVITVVYGDTSGGSRGTRAQTYRQDVFDFQISVDRLGAGVYEWLPVHPYLEIIATEPDHLEVFVTGDGSTVHPVRVLVRAIDKWGNPARGVLDGDVELTAHGVETDLPTNVTVTDGTFLCAPVNCLTDGFLRISAEHSKLGRAESAPLKIQPDTVEFHPFWGDLHGQSEETVGSNSATKYFHYARDFALCDFSGHQGNDFQITDEFWVKLNTLSAELTKPGQFIVMPGYEWSGLTPIGGDRNVLFLEEGKEIRRSSLMQVQGKAEQPEGFAPLPRLYENLKASGDTVLVIPHIGGRRANLDFFDPELEPVIEVHSCWGTFEWFYHDALQRGYRVGVVANSDGHKGRPGAEHAGAGKFGVLSGQTCILADAFERESFFHALKKRRCYGTSGSRIYVNATLDGHLIGEDVTTSGESLALNVEVAGATGIEGIDLLAAGVPIQSWEASEYKSRSPSRVRLRWSGARILNRRRATEWDGSITVAGNSFSDVEGYAFDSPAEGIQAKSADSVTWKSITTGDEDGLLLILADGLTGTLAFETSVLNCAVELGDLSNGPLEFEAGGVEQKLICELAPEEDLSREVVWESQVLPLERHAVDGVVPYHLRIRQVDGHRAWTSPWFVRL